MCMKNIDKLLEIEALTENLTKHFANNNLLRIKVLYFISQYENLSVSMIIEKLGLKKSNFAHDQRTRKRRLDLFSSGRNRQTLSPDALDGKRKG